MSLYSALSNNPAAFEGNPKLSKAAKQRLLHTLVKCGDLLGDGDLGKAFERQVRREYDAAIHQLYPNLKKIMRAEKADKVNKAVKAWLGSNGATHACGQCNTKGSLMQTRSGARVVICTVCKAKYKLS